MHHCKHRILMEDPAERPDYTNKETRVHAACGCLAERGSAGAVRCPPGAPKRGREALAAALVASGQAELS